MVATPTYTSSARIMIDNRSGRTFHEVSSLTDQPPADASGVSADVENQLEVLRSDQIGLAAVKYMNLANDPAFTDPPKSWLRELWASLKAKMGIIAAPTKTLTGAEAAEARQLEALKNLNRNLAVSRVGHTFVLEVQYTATDPDRAAEIANGYAEAFMREQVNSRIESAHRARDWLKQRIDELRDLHVKADLAVQKFRADNNLLEVKGLLVSDQEFNEMTTQLVSAQSETFKAKARYLHLKNIIDTKQTESAVSESLANPIINDLRKKYLDLANRLKDLEVARNLAPTHAAIVNYKNQMDELQARLFEELGRVAESYRNDYEVAVAREKSLAENLARQKKVAVEANDAQVKLRQLEQQADSYKGLYESYMQRFQGSAQQETFPLADQHIVSAANPSLTPTFPRKPIVLGLALALGAAVGGGLGLLREMLDRVFRTAEQIRDELGVEALGLLPNLPNEALPRSDHGAMAPIMRYVIDDPFSAFAETLRSAKVAADLALHDQRPKIIGVASLVPREGKSTVAKNFASLLALQGAKTLLIDADTRNPALTRAIGCERRQGSEKEALLPPLSELVKYEPDSKLLIVPCIYSKEDPRVADGLTSETLHRLLAGADQIFDYIILDLPPVGPVVNARGMASSVDAFIFVVAWGETSRGAVRAVLTKEHAIRDKLLGVILNKVDMKKLRVYEDFGSDGYYHRHYDNYYKKAE